MMTTITTTIKKNYMNSHVLWKKMWQLLTDLMVSDIQYLLSRFYGITAGAATNLICVVRFYSVSDGYIVDGILRIQKMWFNKNQADVQEIEMMQNTAWCGVKLRNTDSVNDTDIAFIFHKFLWFAFSLFFLFCFSEYFVQSENECEEFIF